MCGIFVSAICSKNSEGGADSAFQHICSKLRNVNALRGTFGSGSFIIHQNFEFFLGPDAQTSCWLKSSIEKQSGPLYSDVHLHLELHASELRLRGNSPVVQPHMKDGNILCWNGEVIYLFHIVCR